MRPNVRAVPVEVVREKHYPRLMFPKNVRDYFDRLRPLRRLLRARLRTDFLEPARRGLHQAETDALAAILQLLKTFRLPFLLAPLRDSDIDDVPIRLAQQAQGQPADDNFIVRMRREHQNFWRIRRGGRSRKWRELTQRIRSALFGEACVFGDEMVVGVHFNFGRLAAATACPTRLLFSSGKWSDIFSASSGKPARKTSFAFCTMSSPPTPEVTRPSTSRWRKWYISA